ncbi:MAG: cytochrome C [Flavobacteriales bacterium]|nr:cytochrome C [Flavobacteriales bacterium]
MYLFKLLLLILFTLNLSASIVQTKHNLSVSGTGSIKASSEKEVCAFCHIPHAAQKGVPLWNRAMPTSSYTMYSSTYLERTSYPTPSDLGSSFDTPGNLSRQCLSCHDGTIAIGGIYAIRGTILGSALSMNNTDAGGEMPRSASGLIGTDLSAHHPVGFEYNPTAMNYGTGVTPEGNTIVNNRGGVNTSELRTASDVSQNTKIKLYSYSGKDYVECSSCHDPHTSNKKFLRVGADNSDSHAKNVKNTCVACHKKDNWAGSAHDTNTTAYTDTNVLSEYGAGTKISDMGCINCHTPHNGEGQPYLLRKIEQNTCFQGAADSTSTASCHQNGGVKDIKTDLDKDIGHGYPLLNTDGVHTNLDYMYGNGVPRNPVGSKGISWSDSMHVECMDCHNQHAAKALPKRVATGSWYPTNTSTNANKISSSGALTGASGIRPTTWPSEWTKATSYTTLESATYEYEICFKCHSSWALDNITSPVSSYNTYSDGSVPFTDVAWEFNPRNDSGHPVTVSSNNRLGSNLALGSNRMNGDWNTNVGSQTMMCSDCHGSNSEVGGTKGPHGSTAKFMLKGTYKSWPTNNVGVPFKVGGGTATWNGRSGNTGDKAFCVNCHNISGPTAHSGPKGEMEGLYCFRCHSAIPHGTQNRRLFVYNGSPAPYNYNNYSMITSFTKDTESGVTTISGNASESVDRDKNCSSFH